MFSISSILGGRGPRSTRSSATAPGEQRGRPHADGDPDHAVAASVAAVRLAHLARFEAIVHHSTDVAMFFDADFVIRWVSPAIREVFGLDQDALVGQNGLQFVHEDDRERILASFVAGPDVPGGLLVVEFRVIDGRGQIRWVEEIVTDLLGDPAVGFVVGNLRDITSRVVAAEQELLAARRDGLTGLANRARLLTVLRGPAHAVGVSGLVFFDVVDLCDVNNSLGAAAGDQLLVQIARRVESALAHDATFARVGNDQFAVLLPATAGLADVLDLVSTIRTALSTPFAIESSDVFVAVCFGVAREPGASDDQLIRRADMALYRAKQKGPDEVVVFEPILERRSQHRIQHASALKRALGDETLTPHYQPVVDLDSGRVVAVEALARWNDPDLGMVPPDIFIPVAEATGMIGSLGAQILRRACADAAGWMGSGRHLQVAVNVSAVQLTDPAFTDLVAGCLDETGLPADRLTLEITESAAFWDLDVAMATLLALERSGVLFSVDDFGTGFSSLVLLSRLPVGAIKIDRSFVAGLGLDDRMDKIVAGTVALGTAIGFHTVAEGIEKPEQAEMLRRMGCDFGQGYRWSPAVPAGELLAVTDRIEELGRRGTADADGSGHLTADGQLAVAALTAVEQSNSN